MTNKKIINEAKNSYARYFRDTNPTVSPKSEDVVLNQEKLANEINDMKKDSIERHESLEVLRKQLNKEAKINLEKTFGSMKVVETKKKMNTEEMYEELSQEKKIMIEKVNDLKNMQLQKSNH